jgi:DNA-binding CsgD family transcriptional regulator
MPDGPLNVIILSQRCLARELLGELLRIRCGARIVAKLESAELPRTPLQAASVFVYDPSGLPTLALDHFIAQLRDRLPQVRVVRVDDSFRGFSAEDIVTSVRGQLARLQVAHEQLTPQEFEVMLAVAAGQRNAEIARRMRRSSKTIEKHRASLLRKLGLRTVAQLTSYAIHHGLMRADAIITPRRQI